MRAAHHLPVRDRFVRPYSSYTIANKKPPWKAVFERFCLGYSFFIQCAAAGRADAGAEATDFYELEVGFLKTWGFDVGMADIIGANGAFVAHSAGAAHRIAD